MPLDVPSLDDRTFTQLLAEGRSLIPRYGATWTNHNPSDPGVTVAEVLAYLAEAAIFRLDQLPDESVEAFLALVGVCRAPGDPVQEAVARALDVLAARPRAVTATEFGRRAIELTAHQPVPVARAELSLAVDELCGGGPAPFDEAPEAALVTVIPKRPPQAPNQFTGDLYRALKERAPVGTRIHVAIAEAVQVRVRARVVRRIGSGLVVESVHGALVRFFDRFVGGPEGTGWPFGRWVYRSEVFQALERLAAVDHVEELGLSAVGPAGIEHAEGIEIPPSAVVDAPAGNIDVTVVDG